MKEKSSLINIVQRAPSVKEHRDEPKLINIKFTYKSLICNGFNSILWNKLRQENGFVYTLQFDNSVTMFDSTNLFAAEVNEDNLKSFFIVFQETMDEFNNTGITTKTFKSLIRGIKNNYPFEKNDSINLANLIIFQDSIRMTPTSTKEFYKNFDLVTKEDLMSYHAEYFTGYDYFVAGISSHGKKKELIDAIKYSKITRGNG